MRSTAQRVPAIRQRCAPSPGFSLVETVIALAVVAVLAAIAGASYSHAVVRGYRAEARGALLDAAAWMERSFHESNRYPESIPIARVPAVGAMRYTIDVALDAATTAYTLTARPIGAMAGDPCGNLTLTGTGLRDRSGDAAPELCWGR